MKEPIHPTFKRRSVVFTRTMDRFDFYLKRWTDVLSLNNWSISVDYEGQSKPNDSGCRASVYASWEYLHALIKVYLPTIGDPSDEQLEYTVVHELMHCMVNPMSSSKAKPQPEEFVVTTTAKALIKAYYSKPERCKKARSED